MADQKNLIETPQPTARRRNSRRGFLRTAGGVAAGTALFMAGCDGDAIPENRDPTASLDVSGTDDMDLSVTFNVDFGDPDIDGQDAFDDEISSAVLLFGNGDSMNIDSPGDVPYTYDQPGQYTAELRVRDNFNGRANATTEPFMVGMDPDDMPAIQIDFTNNFGVLNYAYALEQLEAAFYATVVANLDGDLSFSGEETEGYFRDVAVHENIHRDFLAAALGDNAIRTIMASELDFGIDFTDADSVLQVAQILEDTGVSAYNGAADLFSDDMQGQQFLTIAGKIVSVEARHAATIRATIEPKSENFADLEELAAFGAVPAKAYDALQEPNVVLSEDSAGGFITTDLTFTPPSGGF